MKKLTTIFSVFAFAAAVANAADIDLIYTSPNAKGEAKWFDKSSWGTTASQSNLPPSDNAMAAQFEWDFQHLYLDRDTTMSYLILNRDIGAKTSTPTLSLYDPETKAETNLTFDISQNVAAGASSATIIKGHGGSRGFNAKVDSMNFIFDGGTINITDSSEGNTGTRTANILIKPENNDVDFSGKTYSYTFNSNVVSTENLYIEGKSASDKAGGVFKVEFNKELSLVNGADYKTLTLGNTKDVYKVDAAGNMTAAGLAVVIGKEATANVGKFKVGENAFLQVDGVLNTNTAGNEFATGSQTVINGTWNYFGHNELYGRLEIKGEARRTGGDSFINLRKNSELVIDGKNKGDIQFLTGIRMFGGGKLVINSDSLDAGTNIWIPYGSVGNENHIEVNASTKLNSFRFGNNTSTIITFADDAILILAEFSSGNGDGWVHELTSNELLTLVNYENGKIRCTSDMTKDNKNDLSVIRADGFEDGSFKWELGFDGTYWLVGTAVPEPAAVAAIFGLAALGFALYRRRR